MTRKKQKIAVALIVALGIVALASADTWKEFTSPIHFSVSYPADWFRFGVSKDRLQLRSSKGGAEAVVIKRGQAEITVVEAEESSTKTLAQVIDYYTQGSSISSRSRISDKSGKPACSDLEEVISKEPPAPPEDTLISVPNIVNTDFFCEVDGYKIVTLLRNWEGDNRQNEYQQVALRMAKSIRIKERK